MNIFLSNHPATSFLYFFAVIGFSMVFNNPICIGISLIFAVFSAAVFGGRKTVKSFLLYLLPLFLFAALINPAFNHEGITILCYLPGGNPLTLESVLYGFGAAAMTASVICWFSSFNKVMTSDKLMFLFGKLSPSLSLVFSMTLRFVPRFFYQIKEISNAQRAIGKDPASGGVFKRGKQGIKILSAQITQSLEDAQTTADSMKARGFGVSKRTAYSNFDFKTYDLFCLSGILIISLYITMGALFGALSFRWYPSVKGAKTTPFTISLYISYALLCAYPILCNIKEKIQWKKTLQKLSK